MRVASAHRLAALYAGAFCLSLAAVLAVVYLTTVRRLDGDVDALLLVAQDEFVDAYLQGGPAAVRGVVERHATERRAIGIFSLLTDATGRPIAGDLAHWPAGGDVRRGRIEFDGAAVGSALAGRRLRALQHRFADGPRLLVALDLAQRDAFVARLRDALLWSTAIVGLLASGSAVAYARRVRRQLAATERACERIIAGAADERLPLSPDRNEFDTLAASVNRVFDLLQRQTAAVRTTFESAAHDLRAPLARARLGLEELLQARPDDGPLAAAIGGSIDEIDRVHRTLGTLLQVAMLDAGALEASAVEVDVAALARELAVLYAPEAELKGLVLTHATDRAAVVRGNRQLLAQAVANVLENALKYVPAGGHVVVRVDVDDERNVALEVADDGPGLSADERARVVRRFERGSAAPPAGGTGLGLALVAAVLQMHGGTLELLPAEPGLRVVARLPAARPPATAP